eukprot:TRINITY_DN11664_c1_g1_i1.p1 TRINITY_DN11664_c1_g1~~TRINITY_DN11664_c1_g1_i1.p1  ORF type:complete len:1203 (+),score=270.10 TRINITY_DN11664_c1_g1_i1:78-3686(+)
MSAPTRNSATVRRRNVPGPLAELDGEGGRTGTDAEAYFDAEAEPEAEGYGTPKGSRSPTSSPRSSPLPSLRAVATTVVGHCKFKRRLCSNGVFHARSELSFQRPTLGTPYGSNGQRLAMRVKYGMPKFGDVQFSSGLMTRFCITGKQAQPSKFFDKVVRSPDLWDLEAPKLILSIMGGAGGMNLDPIVEAHLCEGLVNAAKQTGGWVITGGTDSGVMDLVGRAMHRHDTRRLVPCIGIAPFGALKSKWREVLDIDDLEPRAHERDMVVVEAPSAAGNAEANDEDKSLAGLQQHHTHCILVDAGTRGTSAFGSELELRERFEQFIAEGKYTSRPDDIGQENTEKLRVMILVNGGPVSFKAMDQAIKNECPVVVCRDSGRAADFIAALQQGRETDYEVAWKKYMTAPADVKMGVDGVPCGRDALERIVKSSCLTVYSIDDRLEDVILAAFLQHQVSIQDEDETLKEALERSMDLAVQWQCVKHYSRIGRKMVATCGLPNTIRWIFSRFATAWQNSDAGPLMRWLLETHLAGVKRVRVQELDPPGLSWSGVQFSDNADDHLAALFLWLVENQAPLSVVDAVWLQLEYPAHAALGAASSYRQAAERQRSINLGNIRCCGDVAALLKAHGDRYEQMAIKLLTGLDRVDPLEYLFRRSLRWGNHHLISLAHHLECKQFVNEPFYNSAVDLLWVTPTPFAVFAFDRDRERRQRNMIAVPYWDVFSGAYFWREDRLYIRDLFSVPRIKAFTHGLSRVCFIALYSYFVLFTEGLTKHIVSAFLFVWGLSLALIEALQYRAVGSFREYINPWNVLDLLLLLLLLGGLTASWTVVPWAVPEQIVLAVHALNLLPCYLRLLQIFELSEYFGTLLFTVFGMAQDTFNFLVLLGIMSLGFSCALTPLLYPSAAARWDRGVTWGFWAIFGEVAHDGAQEGSQWISCGIGFLKYSLYLTSNVLLVNLLIAMLNDTYVANKDESKREWAFNRVDAVLEFASPEAHILPPPLDLVVSVQALFGRSRRISRKNKANFCVVQRVVPIGPHMVEIHISVEGRDPDAAPESTLRWGNRVSKAEEHVQKSDNESILIFNNVALTMPLEFTFGREEFGYSAVYVSLDEDTWSRPLTRVEQRSMVVLQQQVIDSFDAEQEKPEEKADAVLAAFDKRLSLCTEEIARLSKVVTELPDISEVQRQNAALRAELDELRQRASRGAVSERI